MNTVQMGIRKVKPRKITVETLEPHQKPRPEIQQQTSTQTERVIPHQEIISNKEILYLVKGLDQEVIKLQLLTNLAKWFNASIHILFWSSHLPTENDLSIFKQKKMEILEHTDWPHVKCTLYVQRDSQKLLQFLIHEDRLCALAFQSKQEYLTNSIFDRASLHEDILVLAL